MKHLLLGLALVLTVFAVPALATDIPFTIEKGYIIIPAQVEKDKSVDVILAAGRDMSVVDVTSLYKVGITPSFSDDERASLTNRHIIFARVKNVILGDRKPVSVTMMGSDFADISKSIGRSIFAILGADFFKGQVVRFDLQRRVVSITDKLTLEPVSANAKGDQAAYTPAIFKMVATRNTILGVSVTLPVIEENQFNNIKVKTLFDTGIADPFSLTPAAAKAIGLNTEVAKGKTVPVVLDSVRVSNMEFKQAPALLYGKEAGMDVDQKDYGIVAGLGLMQNFIVTFDFVDKRIVLEALPKK